MAIAHTGSATSKTANNNTNTSLTVTLGSTTAGHLNVIDIVAQCGTASTNVGFNTPSGWTKIGEAFDTSTSGPVTVASYYRFFVGGDSSTVSVTWTTAGQAVAGASGYSGVDTSTQIPTASIEAKGTTDTSYSASMTTGVAGWVRSGFGNRSGHTFSAMADTSRGSDLNTSAVSIAFQDSAADVSSGTITRTATGSGSTSIGAEWVYLLQPASAGGTNYSWTIDEGLSLGETIATSTLATIDTIDDVLGLTDTTSWVLNTGVDPSRIPDFTFLVELAPTATPSTSAPSYTDVTSYVVLADPVTLSRGREDEGSTDAQPGRASWTMNNSGGAFTPGDTGSTFAPFQLRRPFRWSVTMDGRSYPLWQGFLDGVTTSRDGVTARAALRCSDRIARLGAATMARPVDATLSADDPTFLYPLRDTTNIAFTDLDATIRNAKTAGGSVTFTGDNSPGGDGDPTAEFRRASTTSGQLVVGNQFVPFTSTGWTIEVAVNPSVQSSMAAVSSCGLDQYANPSTGLTLGLTAGGIPYFESYPTGATLIQLYGSTPLPANEWSHLAVTYRTSDGLTTFYVNGVSVGTATNTNTVVATPRPMLYIGGHYDYAVFPNWAPFDGYLAYAGYYLTQLSAARILEHATAIGSYTTDTTTSRFSRIVGFTSTPSSMVAAVSGGITVGSQRFNGRSALDAINDIPAVDGGYAYADALGILHYAPASTRYNAAVAVTLDATKVVLAGTAFDTDDALLVNSVTYTAADGSVSTYTDTTSTANNDTRAITATTIAPTAATAYSAASWLVLNRANPTARSNSIDIELHGYKNAGGNVGQLLSLDIGSRFQVAGLPDDLAPSNTLDLFVEGITHRISGSSWVMSITTSPVGYYGQVFTIDSATLGLIDGSSVIAL